MEENERARPLAIVGIGASAGGLESLEKFFRALPSRTGATFVVVQHLSPEFKSVMDELMARFTTMAVKYVAEGVEPQVDHIYLMPAGKELELRQGQFRLTDRDPHAGLTLPIDRFLTSLAHDVNKRAVAIILSGSGTDGSRGARRVHEEGGLVMVEEPESARFDGMPRATLSTGVVDVMQPAESLADALIERLSENEVVVDTEEELLRQATVHLRAAFGIDFSSYKLPMLLRRLGRRVVLQRQPDLASYVGQLESDPDEVQALGHDLMIGVTRFFRDPATWEALETSVLPRLVQEASTERGLRAWVAGCATGEEAYSLAMALLDAAAARPGLAVKVFATDVHRRALDSAGHGIYSAAALEPLGEVRRRRYFVERPDDRYQVSSELRGAVVFAHHNLLKDAPFTQLDVASCRNLLIYFQPSAQRQALALLQHGLRIGGVLMLGPSENLGEVSVDFTPIDERHRLFAKSAVSRRIFDLSVTRQTESLKPSVIAQQDSQLLSLYDALLDRVMPPAILIAPDRTVLDSFSGAEQYLRVGPRRRASDVIDLVPESVRLLLAGQLSRAARDRVQVRSEAVPWPANGLDHRIDLLVDPVEQSGRLRALLVRLSPTTSPLAAVAEPTRARETGPLTADHVAALEQELTRTHETLQATIEELESTSEEMQATNEELIASNEEIQSTNEELHSVNEELHSVNAELQTNLHVVSDLNRDLGQLFDSIDVALVFLDHDLHIRRFTPSAARLFGLLPQDIGRPMASFRHSLRYSSLMDDIIACRDGRATCEREVDDEQGGTHLVRVHTQPEGEGQHGIVLSITDLTALTAARARADLLSSIVSSSADAIIGIDRDRRITAWNRAAETLYGYGQDDALGMRIDRLVPEHLLTELTRTLERVWAGAVTSIETLRQHRDGTLIDISTTLSPVYDRQGVVVGGSKIDRDIRERKRQEAALAERERLLADLYDNSPDMVASVDLRTGILLEFNRTLQRTLGYSPAELRGMHFSKLYPPSMRERAAQIREQLERTGELRDIELIWMCKDGTHLEVTLNSTLMRDAEGRPARSRSVIRDETARRQASRQLAEVSRMRERFLALVSHELRTPLYATRSAVDILSEPRANDDKRRRALEVLRRQTAQMNRLLDDLLDVERIGQDRFRLERVVLDLREPVRAAIDASLLAHEGRARVEFRGTDAALPLLGDSARLQQLAGNLLSNAIRHTRRSTPIVVSLSRVGEQAQLVVQDEGDGIVPERLGTLFDLFSRGEDTTPGRSGLGLGLNVARRIVEGHGGTIHAESEGPGKGARFVVDLPLVESFTETAESDDSSSHLKLVVIEDQPDSLEMVTMLLEMRGFEVVPADDGTSGIEAILRERPHLALVDIGLPDMTGYDVARAVRAKLGDSVPLIALTGYGQPEDIRRAMEAGFRRHLTKPLDQNVLERIIRETVTQGPPVSSAAPRR